MAMVSVVNWQPKGGLMVQADRLGSKVGGRLVNDTCEKYCQ